MESFKQAFILGLLSAIAVFISSILHLPGWVLFIAWTSYFIFGTNIKTAILILIQQSIGILIGLSIQYLSSKLSENLPSLGAPIIVFFALFGVFYLSKLKKINSIPAYFLGLIIWFGANTEINKKIIPTLILTLIIGFSFGWLNVKLVSFFEQKKK